MKEIPLTQGKVALVDDDMFEYLNQWKWHYDGKYAVRIERTLFGKKHIRMHVQVVGTSTDMDTDHINRNRLDNRLENLRICTHRQNMMNREKPSNNTSGYKGVSKRKNRRKWEANINYNGKIFYLGVFKSAEDAASAYDEAAKKYFGEYAKLNFPSPASNRQIDGDFQPLPVGGR